MKCTKSRTQPYYSAPPISCLCCNSALLLDCSSVSLIPLAHTDGTQLCTVTRRCFSTSSSAIPVLSFDPNPIAAEVPEEEFEDLLLCPFNGGARLVTALAGSIRLSAVVGRELARVLPFPRPRRAVGGGRRASAEGRGRAVEVLPWRERTKEGVESEDASLSEPRMRGLVGHSKKSRRARARRREEIGERGMCLVGADGVGLAKDGRDGEVGEVGANSVISGRGEVAAAVKGEVGAEGFGGEGPTMAK